MTWFKVDDGFHSHPKVMGLTPAAGWLWVRSGSYCAQHLTDGVVPTTVVKAYGTLKAARELVYAGLWDIHPDGYEFHDWATYQPSREDVIAERKASAARQKRARERARESQQSHGVTPPVTAPVRHGPPDPTRPDHKSIMDATAPPNPHENLTNEIHQLRPDWDIPGIQAALTKAFKRASSPTRLRAAALHVARDPSSRTPGRIALDGNHWTTDTTRDSTIHVDPCKHGEPRGEKGCALCRAEHHRHNSETATGA